MRPGYCSSATACRIALDATSCADANRVCPIEQDNYEINLGMQPGTLLYNWEVRIASLVSELKSH